ncbi:MAG: hypothetical protein M1827_004724 [Pycnora praestabilis]|nr:MAG: hypothetical protein M1827_004724 [Pycnora praestabilis]
MPNEVPLRTIILLESRLRRLEFVLTSGTAAEGHRGQFQDGSITTQLSYLDSTLHKLSSKSMVVKDLLNLYRRYPDLFQSLAPIQIPTSLSTANLLSIIVSSASLYPTTASRLTSIQDSPIPQAEASATLVALQPRIARMEILQDQQTREMTELRARSADALERWYQVAILSGGQCWADWEGRMTQVEQGIRRQELLRVQEEQKV